MQAKDMRKGTAVIYQNEIHIVTDYRLGTPGNLRSFVQATLKNLKTGRLVSNKFASDDEFPRAIMEPKQCQFMYKDEQGFHFMDMEDYHTFAIGPDIVGEGKNYLKENMEIKIDFYEGNPVSIELPKVVILKIVDSPPGIRGDSVSNKVKPATCETGLKLNVPMFVEEGNEIKVNTETGEYGGRA
jgi:elongation factor P